MQGSSRLSNPWKQESSNLAGVVGKPVEVKPETPTNDGTLFETAPVAALVALTKRGCGCSDNTLKLIERGGLNEKIRSKKLNGETFYRLTKRISNEEATQKLAAAPTPAPSASGRKESCANTCCSNRGR